MKSEEDLFVPTGNVFVEQIEHIVWMEDISYMEAVISWCDRHGLEPETAASIIKKTPMIKEKVKAEAEALNYLPKENRLPL